MSEHKSYRARDILYIPRAWAKAITTSWHVVSSVTPQTTRRIPSTDTFTSIVTNLLFLKRQSFLNV